MPTREQLNDAVSLAVQGGLADRRSMLLIGIPVSICANLELSSKPADQLMLDAHGLYELPDAVRTADGVRPIDVWLANVSRALASPPVDSAERANTVVWIAGGLAVLVVGVFALRHHQEPARKPGVALGSTGVASSSTQLREASVSQALAARSVRSRNDVWRQLTSTYGLQALAIGGEQLWTSDGNNLLAKPIPTAGRTDSEWVRIGVAQNLVAMVGRRDELFAVDTHGRLWVRPAVTTKHAWAEMDQSDGLIGLAVRGDAIIGAYSDGRVATRTTRRVREPWRSYGRLERVTTLTSIGDELIAVADGRLLMRSVTDEAWTDIGNAKGISSLAGVDSVLYALKQVQRSD